MEQVKMEQAQLQESSGQTKEESLLSEESIRKAKIDLANLILEHDQLEKMLIEIRKNKEEARERLLSLIG